MPFPESAILTDVEGIILAANETIARRFGKIPRQLIGQQFYDLLPPDVADSRRRHIAESIRTGEPLRFEDVRYGRYIDNYVHPIKDAHGQVKRLAILGVDVTEHKEALEKLKEQAALLDIGTDAILVKDLDNRILYWNKGAERIYGWSADEAAGKDSVQFLFAESHVAEALLAQKETLEKGAWQGDLHQRNSAGGELVVEGRWTLMKDDSGNPRGILSVNTDVTAQRSIQAQLLSSQRLESLGTLAGGSRTTSTTCSPPSSWVSKGFPSTIPILPSAGSWTSSRPAPSAGPTSCGRSSISPAASRASTVKCSSSTCCARSRGSSGRRSTSPSRWRSPSRRTCGRSWEMPPRCTRS